MFGALCVTRGCEFLVGSTSTELGLGIRVHVRTILFPLWSLYQMLVAAIWKLLKEDCWIVNLHICSV
jgi:hypothetical protein